MTPQALYDAQISRELDHYNEVSDVHALPEMFHYWSSKYLGPMLEECSIRSFDDFYAEHLVRAAQRTGGTARLVSVGAGNCDTEVRVAKLIRERGLLDFTIECLEINPSMLARGREHAVAGGVAEHIVFTQTDFNVWKPSGVYAGMMANQSLHHVTNLEGLFDGIKASLHPKGYFVTSDMIGRNGHQRWPEALSHVDAIWADLPDAQRYNQLLKRHEPNFINHDCSDEGFEGVRAQDILPLLLDRFDFPLFAGFANVINPFVDRCFGHNFNADSPEDRAIIDRAHAIDEEGFRTGELKPTQMLAVMSPTPVEEHIYARGLSPQQAVRPVSK